MNELDRVEMSSRKVLILGIDTFARKNVVQIRSLEAEGYSFAIVTNDQRGDSQAIFDDQMFTASELIVVKGFRQKIATAWRLLRCHRFNHVELSPAGRMALFYLMMLRMLRIPFLVIERGDIGSFHHYDVWTRLSLRLAYRYAARLIYKETYMEKPLKEMSRSPLHFIPNCVERAPRQSDQRRSIDFLWVNRIIPERKAEWVVSALRDPVLAHASLTLLGIETRSNLPGHVKEEQARLLAAGGGNITLLPFADPGQYYERAKFFCLPGTIVFGNNSLLEAMASGVVPLVTEAPGVELIIEDGVNGFVTALDEQAYRDAMARAAAMTDADWRRISESAMATVQDKYSVQAWTRKMADVYARF